MCLPEGYFFFLYIKYFYKCFSLITRSVTLVQNKLLIFLWDNWKTKSQQFLTATRMWHNKKVKFFSKNMVTNYFVFCDCFNPLSVFIFAFLCIYQIFNSVYLEPFPSWELTPCRVALMSYREILYFDCCLFQWNKQQSKSRCIMYGTMFHTSYRNG